MSETFVAPTLFSSPLENGEEKSERVLESAAVWAGLVRERVCPKMVITDPVHGCWKTFPRFFFFPSSKACRLLNDIISYRRERLMLRYAAESCTSAPTTINP